MADVTVEELAGPDAHAVLARLRASEPVAWIPSLNGWLVTGHDLVLTAMRDAQALTVDDPRFTTGRVIGPSMLSRDGAEHRRHRTPFTAPFRAPAVRERFTQRVEDEAVRLVAQIAPAGHAELRTALAAPLAASVVATALGLERVPVEQVLAWYGAIVDAVTQVTAGEPLPDAGRAGFAQLRAAILPALDADPLSSLVAAAAHEAHGALDPDEVVSNAAVLLFGGIETTEGMIANAFAHLLDHPDALAATRADPELAPAAAEESLRLEPAAATVDRYATQDLTLGGARIAAGDLVMLSLAAANRDPARFSDPETFVLERKDARRHVAFAGGPHVCIGVHLARLEVHTALRVALDRLPGLRRDPRHPAAPATGLVFRKPEAVHAAWDQPTYVGSSPRSARS